MTLHWSGLNAEQKVQAIKSVWRDGMSAADLASHFPGATRRAIIGLYSRNQEKLSAHRLLAPCGHGAPMEKRFRSQKRKAPVKAHPVSMTVAEPGQFSPLGVSLVDLGPHECKWPINDAALGETHLFCGAAAEGSYCEVHSRLAYQNFTERKRKEAA